MAEIDKEAVQVVPGTDRRQLPARHSKRLYVISGWIFRSIVALVVGIFFIMPIVWMISAALKPLNEVFRQPIEWIPHPILWGNIGKAISSFPFAHDLMNTFVITLPSVVGTVISSSMVAYGITRIKWKFGGAIFIAALATMMIPQWITAIPLFILFSKMHWINTFWPLIVPNLLGNGFSIFLLRQFFLQQPQDLFDAAFIDGAGHWYSFLHISLPLAKPALVVVGLFAFIASWTDFFNPLIYLSTPDKFTLMLGLQSFQSQHTTLWNYSMAVNVIVLLPILILFFFAQRTLIEGITFTGIK